MNRIDLGGRIAIVTGAARGIGRAIAERFSASGAKVAIWDVDCAAAATSLAVENATYDIVDVTDPAGIARALEATEARLGPPDILVNNAGIAGPNLPLAEYPPEDLLPKSRRMAARNPSQRAQAMGFVQLNPSYRVKGLNHPNKSEH